MLAIYQAGENSVEAGQMNENTNKTYNISMGLLRVRLGAF
jgi:hypothetical protein